MLFALEVSLAGDGDAGWAVIGVVGELELATAPRLRQAVVSLVGDGHTRVVLDLSQVDFVDSVGLGVIVSALKRIRGRGGELVVAGASPRVRGLFELTRLDEIIELRDRVDDVVRAPLDASGATVGEVVLEIPARPEYVALARQVVAAAAGVESSFHDDRIDDLRLAVSEATTNAIEAHADLSSDERVVIRCDLGSDRVEVEVVDRGSGFDPGRLEGLPESIDPAEHGLGIPLIRELADESEITTSSGGTRVRLVVYRVPRKS